MVAILWGSFATCVQREQSPHHSAWQTRSSEDQKPFLAWNVLWNVFENKVVNDNCHQKLALSNAFFIVSRPQRACLVLRSQMVRVTDNHAYLSVCRHMESTPGCLIAHLSPTSTPTVPRGRWFTPHGAAPDERQSHFWAFVETFLLRDWKNVLRIKPAKNLNASRAGGSLWTKVGVEITQVTWRARKSLGGDSLAQHPSQKA